MLIYKPVARESVRKGERDPRSVKWLRTPVQGQRSGMFLYSAEAWNGWSFDFYVSVRLYCMVLMQMDNFFLLFYINCVQRTGPHLQNA